MKSLCFITTFMLMVMANQASAVGYLADFTLYDRTENQTLPVYYHNGRYYVVGKPGNEYQINIRNQAGNDLLAVVSVDGVNVITGQTASPSQSGYVIDPWRTQDIKGWRKGLDRIAAFYFTRLSDSYAARTGRPDNVGVIGVALFKRKPAVMPLPEPQPYYQFDGSNSSGSGAPYARQEAAKERSSDSAATAAPSNGSDSLKSPSLRKDKKLGTGHGRSESSYASYTTFERATEAPEEVITIYYDSYRNLLAQGVIPVYQPPQAYRTPQPFPSGFVPDPRW